MGPHTKICDTSYTSSFSEENNSLNKIIISGNKELSFLKYFKHRKQTNLKLLYFPIFYGFCKKKKKTKKKKKKNNY